MLIHAKESKGQWTDAEATIEGNVLSGSFQLNSGEMRNFTSTISGDSSMIDGPGWTWIRTAAALPQKIRTVVATARQLRSDEDVNHLFRTVTINSTGFEQFKRTSSWFTRTIIRIHERSEVIGSKSLEKEKVVRSD